MSAAAPHIPVLLDPILTHCAPIRGIWLDGTFGAGGYTRGLLDAGAAQVIAVDRDPAVFAMAAEWAKGYGERLKLVEGTFSDMDQHGADLDGVVLDLGVSSMQLDQAERGFSFMRDGPLDMRMSQAGRSAADIVADATEAELADILFHYGEERAARRIARTIVAARDLAPITTTLQLADLIEGCLPRKKPGGSHPATRSFQALRIAVNSEYDQLFQGLMAAERALKPGGLLAVVTFHSVEDRMVKRFLQLRGAKPTRTNKYAKTEEVDTAPFDIVTRKAVAPSAEEMVANTRARSAKLRIARRTSVQSPAIDPRETGMPMLPPQRRSRK
ncbi:16S rRNA (cytosine(1402)-N(4))-methyltransferase RsmH [Shimia ponticola]|uniref:16S rRNA (cytosine(1402)-N(4))-methyltransferase RsmH n=1 Tax=Shimia ponticola TaxID=2582893 RepID=UPI0011BDDB1A|nr:16S rRNA (cytosine(1402)-N(4))-methyltransferase RsmH [Shimia ponticola]